MPKPKAGFEARVSRIKAKDPTLSHAQAVSLAKESFRPKSEEARQRQLSGLSKTGRRTSANTRTDTDATRASRRRRGPEAWRNANIVEFAEDFLGVSFAGRPAQKTILKAAYGLPLRGEEKFIYRRITDGAPERDSEALEIVLACGARGGKSLLTAICALFESIVRADHFRRFVGPKEVAYGIVVATRQQQARDIIQANAARLLLDSPLCSLLADEPTQERITLTNHNAIMALPCNSTAGRGLPVYFLALDEAGHFYSEGVRCDEAIYNSLSPRLAQFPKAKTMLVSTPASKQGLFWTWFSEGFSVPGRLTCQAPTLEMNPLVDAEYLARQKARDPDNYAREFDAQFAERLSGFFATDRLENCYTLAGDVPPCPRYVYAMGVDQSGLSGRDRFALAIAHADDTGGVVVDVTRSWDTADLTQILAEIAELSRAYHVVGAFVDAYSAGWIEAAFTGIGLLCERRPGLPQVYANTKRLAYASLLALPDNQELRDGLAGTVGYYGRNQSLAISHERSTSGHADLADAVCTAIWAVCVENEAEETYERIDLRERYADRLVSMSMRM